MVQKTINDYYEQLYEEFPNIPKSDIKRICNYGLKSIYLHNSYGCDVVLQRGNFWMYCGTLMKNALDFFQYYKRKLKTKLRILYKRNQIQWDGYYYFALTQDKYNLYKSQKSKKGRPKKKFTFNNIVLRKIYEECLIEDTAGVAIFKIPFISDLGFDKFMESLSTDKAELILEKETTKMKDIITSNYTYEIIKNKKYKK